MLEKNEVLWSTELENTLERVFQRDDECLRVVCGALESLSADMLSPDETRRLADCLDQCEDCRAACASIFALKIYDDAPFGDRMRAFRDDPSSETDGDWRRIAFAFDPTLKPTKEYEAWVEARVVFNVRRVKAKNEEEAKINAQKDLEQFLSDLQADRDYAPDSKAYVERFGCGEVLEVEEIGGEEE